MNPDQNRSGMTVNALLQLGLLTSTAVPVLLFAILGLASFSLDHITFILVVIVCAIILLLVVLITNYYVQRNIKSRIVGLVDVCRDYASGDRSIRAVVNGEDEFAQLSSALNAVLDNQGAPSSISMGSSGSDAAALQAQIEKLLQEVSAVGDGDLRVQAEVTPDTLGVLADSFNYMIEELAKVVGRVQSTAVQVTNATRRILDRSAELAQATETQVKQIAQTTEAVEALAVFIQNVARNAQLSVDVAQEALRSANTGQQAVRQTIEGMMLIRENVQETAKKIKRLGERSNEIGEIVRIIEDIADQTNLLALNAAIQSAMAGEHGRGFAVVADEIRLLAERSTESTKRIATLVKSIQGDTYEAVVAMEDSTQEVVKGSQLADDAGRSLNSIYSAVERQAQMIENIARAANEQTSVSEAVAVAMGRISEITRQTDAGTQEAAVSVSYLAELSEQLRASVSTFRLPDRTNDMLGSFSNMTSVNEVSDKNNGQMFGGALGAGGDGSWGQGFSGNFPPLPEPGNTGSLVSLTSRSGQYAFNNQQQDFALSGNGFSSGVGQQAPSQMGGFGGQQGFGGQPAFGNSGNGGNSGNQPFFGNQVDFGDLNGFEGSQLGASGGGFGGQQSGQNGGGFGGQQYGGNSGFTPQGQQYYQPANPGFVPQNPNSNLLPTPPNQQPRQPQQGQSAPARPRWQQDQNQ
jgi:twitching motility protein PilJ